MTRFSITTPSLILILSLGLTALGQIENAEAEKREAEKAWELLIKAKGGREKLHSVSNLLTRSKWYASEKYGPFTRLDVFPNVTWDFRYSSDDQSVWRPSLILFDIPKRFIYFANQKGIYHKWQPDTMNRHVAVNRLAFLLETKWDRPEPVRIMRAPSGRKALDVIKTRYGDVRIDFMFDPEDMLVVQVDVSDADGSRTTTVLTSDYVAINGIQMPRTWAVKAEDYNETPSGFLESKSYAIDFEFNVDFNPDIFRGNYIRAGSADDWKARGAAKKEKRNEK